MKRSNGGCIQARRKAEAAEERVWPGMRWGVGGGRIGGDWVLIWGGDVTFVYTTLCGVLDVRYVVFTSEYSSIVWDSNRKAFDGTADYESFFFCSICSNKFNPSLFLISNFLGAGAGVGVCVGVGVGSAGGFCSNSS